MISLLSPAKNLDFSEIEIGIPLSDPIFLEESEVLMKKLKKLSVRQISKLMALNPQLSQMNFERYQDWNSDYIKVEQKAAALAFNGEVYRGLRAGEMNPGEISFLNEHVFILSGLHGLLRSLDRIQPYRLEMGTKLMVTGKKKNLYQFWGDKITKSLDEILLNHDHKTVINLASIEYTKVIDRKSLKSSLIDIQFLDWKNGAYTSVMTWAKQARGAMAREIVVNKIDNPSQLKEVEFNGYHFNKTLSEENELVFTRKA